MVSTEAQMTVLNVIPGIIPDDIEGGCSMKKFLSVFLAAMMLLGCAAVSASAEGGDVIEVVYLSSTILETPEGVFEAALVEKS